MVRKTSNEELTRGGVLAFFGLLLLVVPGSFARVLLILFGVMALVDGCLAFVELFRSSVPPGRPRWVVAIEAMASIVAGAFVLLWPGLTSFVLFVAIGIWAVVTGAAELGASLSAERGSPWRGVQLIRGVLLLVMGTFLFARPVGGAIVKTVIALVAIGAGVAALRVGSMPDGLHGGARRERTK